MFPDYVWLGRDKTSWHTQGRCHIFVDTHSLVWSKQWVMWWSACLFFNVQYGKYKRKQAVEALNNCWKRHILSSQVEFFHLLVECIWPKTFLTIIHTISILFGRVLANIHLESTLLNLTRRTVELCSKKQKLRAMVTWACILFDPMLRLFAL